MAEKLEVVITADDKTSGVLGGIRGALGGIGSFAVGALKVGLGAAAVGLTAVGAAAIKSVMDASSANEMLSKFAVTFGEAGQELQGGLEAFGKETGRNKFELMGMAANLGAVMKGMGGTEDMAGQLSEGFTELAVDVGSFNNLSS